MSSNTNSKSEPNSDSSSAYDDSQGSDSPQPNADSSFFEDANWSYGRFENSNHDPNSDLDWSHEFPSEFNATANFESYTDIDQSHVPITKPSADSSSNAHLTPMQDHRELGANFFPNSDSGSRAAHGYASSPNPDQDWKYNFTQELADPNWHLRRTDAIQNESQNQKLLGELPIPTCTLCGSIFPQAVDLDTHIHDVHPIHRCEVCEREFTSADALERHVEKSLKCSPGMSDSLFCAICGERFENWVEKNGHHWKVHVKQDSRPKNPGAVLQSPLSDAQQEAYLNHYASQRKEMGK